MTDIGKLISVIGASCVAFKVALPTAKIFGLTFLETLITVSIGGSIGVLISFFAATYILKKVKLKRNPNKKIFTKTNRRIINITRKYGLMGISFITPPLLSIPLGSLIASRLNIKFYKNTKKVIFYLLISVYFWALIMAFIVHFLPDFNVFK